MQCNRVLSVAYSPRDLSSRGAALSSILDTFRCMAFLIRRVLLSAFTKYSSVVDVIVRHDIYVKTVANFGFQVLPSYSRFLGFIFPSVTTVLLYLGGLD